MHNHVLIDRKVRFILIMLFLVSIFTIALYNSETTISTVGYTIKWLAQ